MATKRKATAEEQVEAFLAVLEHPLKAEIIALREIIRGADPAIIEEIKWNAPSFRTSEHFATMQLRATDSVLVILHLGAKKRDTSISGITINDPNGLLKWLAKDRASVKFHSLEHIRDKQPAFEVIIRQWITFVE